MSIKNLNPRLGILMLFILAAGVLRVLNGGQLTPFSNITPIGAMALFGGAYFSDKWKSYIFPLLTLFVSDVLMMELFYKEHMQGLLYSGWIWTYLSFAAMVLVGQLIIRKVNATNVLVAAVAAVVAHWIIADIGPFLSGIDITTGQPFPKNAAGFAKCLALAIPYMKNMLIGNLVYSIIFFGGFELVQRSYPAAAAQS